MNINQKINSSSLNSAKLMIEELSNRYKYKENLFNTLSENLKKQQGLSDSLNLTIKRINKNLLNSRLSAVKEIQKSSSFSLSENLKKQQSLSDSLNLAINEYPLNSHLSTVKEIEKSSTFFSPIRRYNKTISEALKFDNIKIPVELITLELPKIEDVIIVSKPHMPEIVQEEIELVFDEYFKENNEIINNPILDMESIRKIILNRYLNFLLAILVLMIQFYSDNKVYHLLINAILLIHSFFLTSDESK